MESNDDHKRPKKDLPAMFAPPSVSLQDELGGDIYKAEPASASESVARRGFQFRSFLCPICHTKISITRDQVGTRIACPDCGTVVTAPTNLNFDAETEYERANYNLEKKRRDELFSPMRNPNREGIKIDETKVYGLDDGTDANDPKRARRNDVKYVPVQCRICETFLQVPESQIGKTITCPDCGSRIEVTAVLKNQKEVVDVKFAPRDRGTYGIGEIPEQRAATIRMLNGELVELDPHDKFVDNSGALNKAFQRAKKARERGERVEPTTAPKDVADVRARTAGERAVEKRPTVQKPEKKENQAEKKKKEKAKARRADDESEWIAPKVLRKRDGQLIWAVPSPPRPFPLFNRTFAVVLGFGFWKRVLILVMMLAICAAVTLGCAFIGREFHIGFFILLLLCVVFPLVLFTFAPQCALYFREMCDAGATGRRRLTEWSEESSIMDGVLAGLYYMATLALASIILPSIPLFCQSALSLETDFSQTFFRTLSCVSASLFFPIFVVSSMYTGSWFMILHKDVLWTLITKIHVWFQLFVVSALLFFAHSTMWGDWAEENCPWLVLIEPFVAVPATGLYALLLGRMAWIIEDLYRSESYDDEE